MTDLSMLAKRAGLKDPDLLKIARPELSPAAAVADLKQRYPGAFPADVRNMTNADFAVADAERRQAGAQRMKAQGAAAHQRWMARKYGEPPEAA